MEIRLKVVHHSNYEMPVFRSKASYLRVTVIALLSLVAKRTRASVRKACFYYY